MSSQTPENATTAMLKAAAQGDALSVLKQARAGADVDAMNGNGKTALMMMAQHRNVIGLNGLLDLGANPDIQNPHNGRTAAHESLYADHSYGFETLIRRNANPNIADDRGWTSVHILTDHHEVYGLGLALSHGGDPTIPTVKEGWNAAHIAARAGHYKMLWPLLDHNPDLVHQRDTRDRTPIFYAVEDNDNISMQILHNKGAVMDLQDAAGDGLAHLATRNGSAKNYHHYPVLRYVLDHGADPNALNNKQENPVFDAVRGHDTVALEVLAHRGAKMDGINNRQETPLMLAKQAGHSYVVGRIEALQLEAISNTDEPRNQGLGRLAALVFAVTPAHDASIENVFGIEHQKPAIWRAYKEERKTASSIRP